MLISDPKYSRRVYSRALTQTRAHTHAADGAASAVERNVTFQSILHKNRLSLLLIVSYKRLLIVAINSNNTAQCSASSRTWQPTLTVKPLKIRVR